MAKGSWLRPKSGRVDSRHVSMTVSGAAALGLGPAIDGARVVVTVLLTVLGAALVGAIGYYSLPVWRDPSHGPLAGAAILLAAAAAGLTLAVFAFR
ncbi:MAG: hypothetical protein QOE76_4112 [Frankiales bacterium]|nr:hypothetical protein [Frankiales bacterium]